MSTRTKKDEVVEKAEQKATPSFFLHELRANSKKLFSVNPEVVDGAFLNVKEQQLTKEQAKKLIDEFLKKEVK